MLIKEQVSEIISRCDTHGVTRRARLMEWGITHWEFYKSRRRHLDVEKPCPQETSGTFIRLKANGKKPVKYSREKKKM